MKFLWNGLLHVDFGRNLARLQPLGKFSLRVAFISNFCLFFPVVQLNDRCCVFFLFCNPLFYSYIYIRTLCFFYFSVFSIQRFKRALKEYDKDGYQDPYKRNRHFNFPFSRNVQKQQIFTPSACENSRSIQKKKKQRHI